jgi:Ca2+-binding EF-hand superfamily protein
MNEFRRDVVERVFIILDKNNDGVIDINDIKHLYNAKKHPDVLTGKRSESQVLMDFL